MSKVIAQQNCMKINPNDNWETPYSLVRSALLNYDIQPSLDVCATEANRKFESYFSKEDDALTQQWNEDFFMNPPYSQIKTWMKYAYTQHKKHNVDALILTQSKTDTKWFHEWVVGKDAEIHFVKGRVKFLIDNIPAKSPAPFSSVWIIYRKKNYEHN